MSINLKGQIDDVLKGTVDLLTGGGSAVIESKSIFANGVYNAPSGVDGYNPVIVDVPAKIEKTLSVTENGTYTPEEGQVYNGVIVNVQQSQPVIQSKTITENGTYNAPSGVDGYSPITVNVPLPQNAYLLKSVANLPQAIASFNDGEEMIMPSLKVAIEPQQEGSGDPSPTNVRPISGWDECNVTVCGKNFFGAKLTDFQNGTAYGLTKYIALRLPYNTYTISTNAPTGNVWAGKETPTGTSDFSRIYDGTSKTVTSDILYIGLASADLETAYSYNTMIEVGSQPTIYEPYNGATYTIDLDGTRYGGEVDVVNGIVTSAPYYASYNGETLTGEWISDRDKYEVGATPTIGAQVVNIGASGTPVSILPTAVKSLRGVNNVWADTGVIKDAEYFSKE